MSHVILPDESPLRVYVVGTTPTSTFPVPFPFFRPGDVHVRINGAEIGAFTVAGQVVDGGYQSGTLTLATPVQSARVVIYRRTIADRLSDFPYPAQVLDIRSLNTEIDRIVAQGQDLRTDQERTLRAPVGDPFAGELPDAMRRAGGILAFDSAGNPIVYPLPLQMFSPSPGAQDPTVLGAKGDGLFDCFGAIQSTINLVAAYGGGRVVLPAGTFAISAMLEHRNGVSLEGQGTDHTGEFNGVAITRLLLMPGANVDMLRIPLFMNSGAVRRIEFYGNRTGNTAGGGIVSQSYVPGPTNTFSQDTFLVIEECCFRACRGRGIDIGPAHRAVRVKHCYAVENGGDGIQLAASDCSVTHCLLGVNGGAGIRLSGAEACKIESNDFFHNGEAQLLIESSNFFASPLPCVSNLVMGNSFDRGEKEAIRLRGAHRLTRVIGNHFNGNGLSAPGAYCHILEEGTADDTAQIVLMGNTFDDNINTDPSTAFDVFIVNATRSIMVGGNLHTGRWTTGLCNLLSNLRLTAGAGDSYTSGAGVARFSAVAVGDDFPLGSGLATAEDLYLSRPNRGILSNLYFTPQGYRYVQNGRGWALIFDDASSAITILSAPLNTAGPGALATVTEASRIGQDGRYLFGGAARAGLYEGLGSPEGIVAAATGSHYMRSDGGAGSSFYVKEGGGSGSTGWVAK